MRDTPTEQHHQQLFSLLLHSDTKQDVVSFLTVPLKICSHVWLYFTFKHFTAKAADGQQCHCLCLSFVSQMIVAKSFISISFV